MTNGDFLNTLESVIRERMESAPPDSYTAKLVNSGISKVAQKIGEEGVEVALAAVCEPDDRVVSESADLLYHLMVLLNVRGLRFAQVVAELDSRHQTKSGAK